MFTSWQNNDQTQAGKVATDDAVAEMFAEAYETDQFGRNPWDGPVCAGSKTAKTCVFQGKFDDTRTITMAVEKQGGEWMVTGVVFEPPPSTTTSSTTTTTLAPTATTKRHGKPT